MGSHALDADATAVMNGLRRIVRLLRLADREAEGAAGLSAAQLFVLHSLWAAPASSVAELATRTLTDQSSVSTVVAKLVARKLVARTQSATDRRRSELQLTTAGEKIVRSAPRMPQVRIVEAVRAMPAKTRSEIVQSLDRLATAIGAADVEPRMLFEDEPPRTRARSSTRGTS